MTLSQVADYTILERIGVGNHGELYRAHPPARLADAGETVVVKVLDYRATPYDMRRLSNELRLFGALESPFLGEVIDAGFVEGTVFYAMVDYPGGTLAEPRRELLRWQRARLVADAARGAHDLHELGVAHRDIRPANVAIDGDRGRLVDLGLAQILPDQPQSTHGIVGTPDYMAPEVIGGDPAGRASDVWSIGVTLHEALTGWVPFEPAPTGGAMSVLAHRRDTPPQIDESLPVPLQRVLGGCLAVDPTARFETAEDAAEAIDDGAEEAYGRP